MLKCKPDKANRREFLARSVGGACALCAAGAGAVQETDERFVIDARHWTAEGDRVTCRLCPRECVVPVDERGFCGVRENQGGQYKSVVYSRPCSLNIDPIEKKPMFHFVPGTKAFSLATAGCNIECKFCQNWQISQMRPEQIKSSPYFPPDKVVDEAQENGCRSIAFTYTEPVVFYEYMFDIAVEAKKRDLYSVMISNGYIHPEPMRELLAHLTAVKIDLKAFTEKFYRDTCRGELKPVLKTLELLKAEGVWFEIVVLIIPTLNDGEDECRRMVRWIKENLGPEVPVHFSRFSPTYKINNLPRTPIDTLTRNYEIARAEGLYYPYIGNVLGHPGEATYCQSCKNKVIERYGYATKSRLEPGGICPYCGAKIFGFWGDVG